MDLPFDVLAALGFLVAVAALYTSLKSLAAARDSAAAAEKTADAVTKQTELAVAQATKYVPPWRLSRLKSSDTILLKNHGEEDALDVRVRSEETTLQLDTELGRIGPGEAREFSAPRRSVKPDAMIEVTWQRPNQGQRRTWREPCP